jgi:hypothetical protein
MAEADKVIKLEPAGLYLEKSVKATDTFGGARALARSGPKRTS